ncbi:MAG TPA: HepT-like ribonuclease domain-containing protein [Streptosporangiaceae bacterium]|nr:HepT-like ribonuclease domain-containing protein [Streptosporangiaceae bacterium]
MRRDLLLLAEMIQAAERAHQLTDGLTLEELQADQLRTESLLWNFTVLGEAAAQLPGDIRDRFPGIPWQQPARLRNRIVHGYWSIDLEILHTTATDQLPAFARDLREILDTLTAETEETPATGEPDSAPGHDEPKPDI